MILMAMTMMMTMMMIMMTLMMMMMMKSSGHTQLSAGKPEIDNSVSCQRLLIIIIIIMAIMLTMMLVMTMMVMCLVGALVHHNFKVVNISIRIIYHSIDIIVIPKIIVMIVIVIEIIIAIKN